MSGVNIPTDSTHLSDQARADMIEEFGGLVDSQFAKSSMMRSFVPVRSITGTDTAIVRRFGKTTIQKVTDGVRPGATATPQGKVSLTVDTVILARDNQALLNTFQADFSVRAELAKDQGKELGKFFDEAFLIQAVKGAALSAPANLNNAFGAGKVETHASANDELDPDLFYALIENIVVTMQDEEIDTDEMVCFVSPRQYKVLVANDKLIDRDFSKDNGDFADGTIKTVDGVPVVKTTRIATAAVTGHHLSNAANGAAYDVSALDADAVAVLLHPMSLLAGETIPLVSNVHWSDIELQWFIDSYMAFGVTNRRPDVCGVVRKAP